MEQTKTSTRVLLVSVIVLLVILLTGPLGYKFGIVPLQPSLISLLIALAGSVLVLLAGLVFLVIAIRNGQSGNRNLVLVAMVLSLVAPAIMLPQMSKARSVPPIHDITTDTDDPPAFVAIKPLRANAPNGSEYGASEAWPAEKLAATTLEAYPALSSLVSDLSVEDAVARAAAVLEEMGLEIVAVEPGEGRVEATATTFWFGFNDDVVVRVVPEDGGSRLDLRSMSRVGQSDVGVNAARIQAFLSRF